MANLRVGRKSGLILRSGSMRRDTIWEGIAVTETTLASPSAAVIFTGLSATLLALRPLTVVRVRGLIFLQSDQQAASERQQAAFGMAVVSEQALAAGVASVPTPATDIDSDLWFVYQMIFNSFTFSDATGFAKTIQTEAVESKGMRKIEDGDDLLFAIETFSTSSGAVMGKGGRMLVKLH